MHGGTPVGYDKRCVRHESHSSLNHWKAERLFWESCEPHRFMSNALRTCSTSFDLQTKHYRMMFRGLGRQKN